MRRHGFHHARPLAGRQAESSFDGFGTLGKHGTRQKWYFSAGQHDGVALSRRAQAPQRFAGKGGRDVRQAAFEAGIAAEQVHAHHTPRRQQAVAGAVEVLVVQHGAGGLMVIQIDAQHIGRAGLRRIGHIGRRVGLDHAQPLVVGRQAEPVAADLDDLGIQLHRGAAPAQLLVAELGDGRRAQAQLHRMPFVQSLDGAHQHPGHHALHVGQFDVIGLLHAHGALHPGRVQVQVAHAVRFRQGDGGRFRGARALFRGAHAS